MLQQIGLVAAGGALGAAMRYLIGEWLNGDGFPYATLTVNLIGSFVLGMLTVGIAQQFVSEQMVLVFATGFLGAFTTMSALGFVIKRSSNFNLNFSIIFSASDM